MENSRPAPRSALGSLAVALVLLATALSLGSCRHSGPTADRVIDRIGTAGGTPTEPPLDFTQLKLGHSTRPGARVPPRSRYVAKLRPQATAVVFAIALTAEGAEPAEVEFRLLRQDGEVSTVLHREVVASSGQEGWRERTVILPPAPAGGEESWLRFETEPLASAKRRLVRPFWSSITVLGAGAAERASASDSVILISLDTLGADYLAGFGRDRGLAPAIEKLRRKGFAFHRAYANYPHTRPSHATMLSGLYPRHHGSYRAPGPLSVPTLADFLAPAGFHTVAVTEDGFAGSAFGFERGFDAFSDGTAFFDGQAEETFARALAWLEQAAARPHRFFLFVHTYEVHSPYVARDEATRALVDRIDPGYRGPRPYNLRVEDFTKAHNEGRQPVPEPELRRMRALYQGEIAYLDRLLGKFLDAVDKLPLAERTLVVVTSDHGDEFSEHGFINHGASLYNTVLHVPLIFLGPGIPTGASEQPVQLADLAPTVLDLLGVEPKVSMDGVSLAPLLRGETQAPRPAFAELRVAGAPCAAGKPPSCASTLAVQDASFKLIASGSPAGERLYDLHRDPGETADVAASHSHEVARLRSLLASYDGGAGAAPQPTPAALDAETRERLRALGYAD